MSVKFQVLRRARPWSGFKLYTLHFKPGRRPSVQNKPNSQQMGREDHRQEPALDFAANKHRLQVVVFT
jgi:hypothetical protein